MWNELYVGDDFDLKHTFENGQCFGWKKIGQNQYAGVIGDSLFLLRQEVTDNQRSVHFLCVDTLDTSLKNSPMSRQIDKSVEILSDYFQLSTNILSLYSRWLERNPHNERLHIVAKCIPGMRILRQPPWECLISFICSSNNNIPRITQMLQKLRREKGRLICEYEGNSFLTFPTPEEMSNISEERYRLLGFGYRAKYIFKTVQNMIALGGESFLLSLRSEKSADIVRKTLVDNFPGVGPKVADCVALFSIDKTDAIPVDTHVWRIACRDYDPSLQECKSLTPSIYQRVGDIFRSRYGTHAGWAHSLLFSAELPTFGSLLPDDLTIQMREFRAKEKEMGKIAKQKREELKSAKPLLKASNSTAVTDNSDAIEPMALGSEKKRRRKKLMDMHGSIEKKPIVSSNQRRPNAHVPDPPLVIDLSMDSIDESNNVCTKEFNNSAVRDQKPELLQPEPVTQSDDLECK